ADEALDAALDIGAARHQGLLFSRDGVDVRRVGGERQLDAVLPGVNRQVAEQPGDLRRSAGLEHVVERLEPLSSFDGIELRRFLGSNVSHKINASWTNHSLSPSGPMEGTLSRLFLHFTFLT